jgi:ribosome-associated protein
MPGERQFRRIVTLVGRRGNRVVGPAPRRLRRRQVELDRNLHISRENPELNVPIADAPATTEVRRQRSLELALAAARTADDNRGQDIVVLDMRGMTPEFDYFVLVTGNSRRQLHAIGDEIERVLQDELGDERLGIEGYNESRWILLDYGSVVVHLFDAQTRDYYALEDLWAEANRIPLRER